MGDVTFWISLDHFWLNGVDSPNLGAMMRHADAEAHQHGSANVCGSFDAFDHFPSGEVHLAVIGDQGWPVRHGKLPDFIKEDEHRTALLEEMQKLAEHMGYTLVQKHLPPKHDPAEAPELPLG